MSDNSRPRPFSLATVLALLAVVIALAVLPLLIIRDSEFGGADGAAETVITEIAPNYEPWFAPLIEPPGGETEGLLFALQAAIGASVIGYFFGLKRGQRQSINQQMAEQANRLSEQQTHASD